MHVRSHTDLMRDLSGSATKSGDFLFITDHHIERRDSPINIHDQCWSKLDGRG